MRKTVNYFIIFLSSIILFSCSYDDSFLKEEIEKIKTDLSSLKEQTSSLKTIVDALNAGKVITKVEKLADDKGFKITFNDGAAIDVLNGEKAPVIGIQEEGGIYYWTITTNGKTDFLLDASNNKLPVTGNDGKPGEPGKPGEDGNTPQMGIDADGYWTVNNVRIKDADGNFVKAQGDSFFKEIKDGEESVTFVLANGNSIVIPKSEDTYLLFEGTDESLSFIFNPEEEKQIKIKFANIKSMDIAVKPEGWTVNLHRAEKYVLIKAPKTGTSHDVKEVVLRGLDKNGLVFMAIAKVSLASAEGFADLNGAFILNEGNMTTENGSLIYISPAGQVLKSLYSKTNGKELGNVTQDLFIKDGKMWIISQNGKDASDTKSEGMLVVANTETMQRVAVYDEVFRQENGKYKLNWPTHLAVLNDENVFIRDNNGVTLFNSKTSELTLIENTKGAAKNRMAVANNKVFVIKSSNLMVFEAGKKEVVHTIDMGASISGVLTSKDGNLWVSTTGNPNKISKVNSQTYEIIKANDITEGKLGAGWGATPGITAKGDTLYYSNATTTIYRHIFNTGQSKLMVNAKDFVQNANIVYNNIAVHPITGDVYLNTIKGYGWDFLINNISVFHFNEEDKPALKASYEDYTRFPAGIFFTANFKQ